jgi:hypothetical protein
MGNGSGVSRGDRNRNARLVRLRELVPVTNAIVGIDLADKKQMIVVTDHDSKVLVRKTFRCRAWDWCRSGLGRRPRRRASLVSRWRVSRPGTAGGCSVSSLRIGRCRSCVSSRC